MNTERNGTKPKANLLAEFTCDPEINVIGVVVKHGTVSLHGYNSVRREKLIPAYESHHHHAETSPHFFFEVRHGQKSYADHYQKRKASA